jgi:hypothetical protein
MTPGFSSKRLGFLLTAFLVLPPAQSRAQERGPGYYIEETGEGPRFVQRLSWEPEEYASRYEVRVEKRDPAGNWAETLTEFTAGDFIEFSLPPGSYRYRVRAFDLLEKPSGNPGWINFEVFPALRPELRRFTPDRVYLNALAPGGGTEVLTLAVRGRNLAEAAEFRLAPVYPAGPRRGGESPVPAPPEEGKPVLPLRSLPGASGERAVLVFAGEGLSPGNYELRVVNPGGLSDSLGTLRVYASKKTLRLFVSPGYGPLVPLYGRLNELLETPVHPAGAYGRIALLPVETNFAEMGLEAAFYWTYISSPYKGEARVYDVSSHILGLMAYGLLRKPLNRSLALTFRLGGGLSSILDFEKQSPETSAEKVNALVPAAGGGLSLQWSFAKFFFAELGAEYTHFFSVDHPSPGYLRPVLGIGFFR